MEAKIKQLTIFGFFVTIIISLMVLGRTLFVPMSWALIFCFIGLPLARLLEKKRVGRATSSMVATLATLLFLGSIFTFLFIEASLILKEQSFDSEKISQQINEFLSVVEEKTSIHLETSGDPKKLISGNIVNSAASSIVKFSGDLVVITLIPMYIFFILYYRGLLMKFIEHRYEGNVKSQVVNFVTKSKISIANYLKGTMMVTGLTALMTLTILLLFGVKYAFFFGSFLAVLALIPYIGNLVGMVVILLYVYITKDSWSITLFVFIALYFSHMIQENFLKPKLLGDKMEMNAAVVFTSVIVGGLIWGFSGMILFIPFAGIVKAFIESSPASRNFAIFFESH